MVKASRFGVPVDNRLRGGGGQEGLQRRYERYVVMIRVNAWINVPEALSIQRTKKSYKALSKVTAYMIKEKAPKDG